MSVGVTRAIALTGRSTTPSSPTMDPVVNVSDLIEGFPVGLFAAEHLCCEGWGGPKLSLFLRTKLVTA